MTHRFHHLTSETSPTCRERSTNQRLCLVTWRSLDWSDKEIWWGCVYCWGLWHRRRCSSCSPPGSHLSSARNLLSTDLSQLSHGSHSATPGDNLPTASCRTHWALLWDLWELYPDLELPCLLQSSRISTPFQNYTGPRLSRERQKATSWMVNNFFPLLSDFSALTFLPGQSVSSISMEHEHALRSESFIAAFWGLLM